MCAFVLKYLNHRNLSAQAETCAVHPMPNTLALYYYSDRIVSIGRNFKACDFCPLSRRRFDKPTISRVQKDFDLYIFFSKDHSRTP